MLIEKKLFEFKKEIFKSGYRNNNVFNNSLSIDENIKVENFGEFIDCEKYQRY